MYKNCSNKQIIFNNYGTNLKMTISDRRLRISDMLLLYFFYFYFVFLIDIIDNIIMYSLYVPYYVTRTSTNGSAVYWTRDTVLYQFLETETSDRYLICIVQCLRFSGVSLHPLPFFLYSPFNSNFDNALIAHHSFIFCI